MNLNAIHIKTENLHYKPDGVEFAVWKMYTREKYNTILIYKCAFLDPEHRDVKVNKQLWGRKSFASFYTINQFHYV